MALGASISEAMVKTLLEKGLLETLILQELRDTLGCGGVTSVTVTPVRDPVAGTSWVCEAFEIASGNPEQCRDALVEIVAKLARAYDLKT